jgi:hypothetical protein
MELRARAAARGVQPNVFDELDWDEAEDLVERLERLQMERDRITFSFLAKLFETTTFILGSALGVKGLPEPTPIGEDMKPDRERNKRNELEMFRERKPGEVRPWERKLGEVMDRG